MRTLLFAAALSLTAISGCSKDKAKPATVEEHLPEMSVEDLDRAIAENQAKAIDCNSDKTRKRFGIVPGAILITDEETFSASELPADKAMKLVFYCSGPG